MLLNPYFGQYGGQFVPELLLPALDQLERAYVDAKDDPAFRTELDRLLTTYAGRPTPLTRLTRLTEGTKTTIYLKREDLLHGGAHKTNQVLGQALLTKRMGKTRVIAETGAGQHGVATALASALFGFKCRIYMGAKDVERQKPNVFRMELMGAEVVPVTAGSGTLKEACNAALRNWAESFEDTHYMLGTAAGPHPFPTIVREFQKVIGEEARAQFAEAENGLLPDAVIACVGGAPTPSASSRTSGPSKTPALSASSPRAWASPRASTASRSARVSSASSSARAPTTCRRPKARSTSRTRSRPASTSRRSAPNTPTSSTRAGPST